MATNIVCIDYKKGFDNDNRIKLCETLRNDRVPQHTTTNLFNTYESTRPHGLTEVWMMTTMMINLSIVYLPIISGLL